MENVVEELSHNRYHNFNKFSDNSIEYNTNLSLDIRPKKKPENNNRDIFGRFQCKLQVTGKKRQKISVHCGLCNFSEHAVTRLKVRRALI